VPNPGIFIAYRMVGLAISAFGTNTFHVFYKSIFACVFALPYGLLVVEITGANKY
jgi:hypothetical protein